MADEKEWKVEAIQRAQSEYLEPIPDMGGIFRAFRLKHDVTLKWFHKVIHEGRYLFLRDEAQEKGDDVTIYVMNQTLEPMEEGDGLRFTLTPASFDYEEPNLKRKGHISLWELLIWATENMLAEGGDTERAKELLLSSYRNKDGRLLSEIKDGEQAAEPQYPSQDTQAVDELSFGLSKLSDPERWKGIEKSGGKRLDVSGSKEPPRYVVVNLTGEREAPLMQGLMADVVNAHDSLMLAGRTFVTARDYAKVVYSCKNPTKNQVGTVEALLDDALQPVTIDWRDEVTGRGIPVKEGERLAYRGPLIYAPRVLTRAPNGMLVDGYELKEHTPFYDHDVKVKQITRVPTKMLEEAAESVSSTERNIKIRRYLLKRLAHIKSGYTTSPKIRYASVMEHAGIEKDPKGKNKRKAKDSVIGYLEVFKRCGYVKDFKEYTAKGDRHATGVHITT